MQRQLPFLPLQSLAEKACACPQPHLIFSSPGARTAGRDLEASGGEAERICRLLNTSFSPDLHLGSVKRDARQLSKRTRHEIPRLLSPCRASAASCAYSYCHHGDASAVTRLRREIGQIGASVRASVAQAHRQRPRRCDRRLSTLSGVCHVSDMPCSTAFLPRNTEEKEKKTTSCSLPHYRYEC